MVGEPSNGVVWWRTLVGLAVANVVLWILASRPQSFSRASVTHAVWVSVIVATCYQLVLAIGIDPAPLFASLGFLVTALSFGGHQIVADVLAGFALVLDSRLHSDDKLDLHMKDGTKIPEKGTCTVREAKLTHLVVDTPDAQINVRHSAIDALKIVNGE